MDSDDVLYSLDSVGVSGLNLTSEQRAALHTSLTILKRNYAFTRVLFWGRILGVKHDYFIAQGVEEDELRGRKCLYSLNCMDWHLLPPATEAMIAEVAVAAKGRFIGDPSHQYEHTEIQQQGEGDDAVEEEVTVKVIEEKRLAVIVFTIDNEAAVVPRGAYIKSPHGIVQTNSSFKGLDQTEAAKLNNYLHFSEPKKLKKISLLEMANYTPSIDFLNPLSDDIPKGSWSLQFEQGGKVCMIRSLLWLGLNFFHMPLTSQHGYIYIGDGLKNLNVPLWM